MSGLSILKLQNISQKSTSQLILGLAKKNNFKVLLGIHLFWDFKPMHFLAPDVSIATVTFFCKLMANQSNSTPIQGQRYKVLPRLASNNTTQQFYDTLWTLLKSDFQTSSGNGLFEKILSANSSLSVYFFNWLLQCYTPNVVLTCIEKLITHLSQRTSNESYSFKISWKPER